LRKHFFSVAPDNFSNSGRPAVGAYGAQQRVVDRTFAPSSAPCEQRHPYDVRLISARPEQRRAASYNTIARPSRSRPGASGGTRALFCGPEGWASYASLCTPHESPGAQSSLNCVTRSCRVTWDAAGETHLRGLRETSQRDPVSDKKPLRFLPHGRFTLLEPPSCGSWRATPVSRRPSICRGLCSERRLGWIANGQKTSNFRSKQRCRDSAV
jgi:hypothetical protein